MRQARVWKRFIRVRTDDLESVRVERAIKRVRSVEAATAISEEPTSDSTPVDTTRLSAFDSETTDVEEAPTTSTSSKPKRAPKPARKSTRKVVITDFEMMRVLGKGCAGKVLLVKHKPTSDLYALKAITKRHVLAHQELQHTLTEQAVLKRMAASPSTSSSGATTTDPFVVKLWWSFHDKDNLFLVMDFHPGGDLATQLARWGRLGRDRARFYAAEIVEGVEGLHAAGVIYRDLKPENILIGGDGHIVLTDFGLSKEFPRNANQHADGGTTEPSTPQKEWGAGGPGVAAPPWMKPLPSANGSPTELAAGWPGPPVGEHRDTTTTFCGTAEYLAPEVIQGLAYSYEVDWWSFGTMLYEMLTGITPFWANNHSDMYVRVLQDELQFPDDRAIDQDTKSLIRGLLQRNPALRICEPRIKRHPYFSMIDWSHVYYKRYIPPYIPPIDPSNASDTQNFDDTFLDMEPVLDAADDLDADGDTDQEPATDHEPGTEDDEANTTPSQSRSSSIHPPMSSSKSSAIAAKGDFGDAKEGEEEDVDVFDGYSFKGRHSVLIDDDDEESDGSGEEESEDEGDILKDLDVGLGPEPEGEPETPTGGVDGESAEATVEGAVEGELDDGEGDMPEPKTPEARPVVAVEPVPELPAKPTKVEDADADAITEEPRAPPTPTAAKEPTPEVQEPVPKIEPAPKVQEPTPKVPEPAAKVPEPEPKPKVKEEQPRTTAAAPVVPPPVPDKGLLAPPEVPPKAVKAGAKLSARPRREKSGVPALDRHLDEEASATEKEDDDEDDDWDFVEAADGEDRNGAKGTSLFARGVVDRYRLAVFRKASTPSRNAMPRSVSAVSRDSDMGAQTDGGDSPSPSQRRGRSGAGLTFRKHPRQFLRAKSPPPPPSSFSSKSSFTSKTMSRSNSAIISASSSSGGLLTPATSQIMPHSLKSKESAMSMGQSSASDVENGGLLSDSGLASGVMSDSGLSPPEGQKRQKSRKLKKYKENAEKVFSFLSSPRQQPT
ncbi:kinase-like domain-containing protein [Mycena alexandri]|uniref:non-specific serine/threonine protein kinase n=1 Tax=Mycena alexandri TaxID=1745969 RepID=A0AAD6XH47_9AGAR|nr:kinase-like domain-containing protein [Mycena alexandri]